MRATIVKKIRRKAIAEGKDYDQLKKLYKNVKRNPQKYFFPRNTVHIIWSELALRFNKKKVPKEAFHKIFTEDAARKILSKRNKELITAAIWYDKDRKPVDLLKLPEQKPEK